MQVNTARASGALSVIPGCLQEYRRESINVLGNVLITVDQLRELNEESGMVEMPELPEFSHHAGIDVSDATLPPQMLHVDQCGCATNLPRNYVSIVAFAEDSSQATLVVHPLPWGEDGRKNTCQGHIWAPVWRALGGYLTVLNDLGPSSLC